MVVESTQGDMPTLISVAMPIYNAGEHLRLAVISIIKQTYPNWELLIIDDGSTDNALHYIEDIQDSRIRVLRDGENKGLAARLNEAIDLARGYYLARMDQDDVSYPERFTRQLKALQGDQLLDVVAARCIAIDEASNVLGYFPFARFHKEICARPWWGFYFPHPTWMGKTSWFRKYRYSVPGSYFCEDHELLLRSYQHSQFYAVDEVLFGYRLRNETNWRKLAKTRLVLATIQWRHFLTHYQLKYVFLTTMTLLGKFTFDVVRALCGKRFRFNIRSVTPAISAQWRDVLNGVTETNTGH